MKRMTTNKEVSEMSMMELAHNSCYAKDRKARYRNYDLDIDARELTRQLLKDHAEGDDVFESDEDFDDWMVDYLQCGMDSIEGLIALFYRNLCAMADLREGLKKYEDLEEQGLLIKLPCKAGDTLYRIDTDSLIEDRQIEVYHIDNIIMCDDGDVLFKYDPYDGVICDLKSVLTGGPYLGYYKVFLTKEEAEKALADMKR